MRGAAVLATVAALSGPALAHPHVWVRTSEVVVYDPDGRMTGIRHAWTFDEGYSAFAVQGLEAGPDGKPRADKLAEFARINVDSLAEYGYFTVAKTGGAKVAFGEAAEPAVTFEGGELTLRFLLPLKIPTAGGRSFSFEVYDPTFFVSFSLAEGEDAVRLAGAPAGCALRVNRPKAAAAAPAANLSESFFSALSASADYGAQFSNRVMVVCP